MPSLSPEPPTLGPPYPKTPLVSQSATTRLPSMTSTTTSEEDDSSSPEEELNVFHSSLHTPVLVNHNPNMLLTSPTPSSMTNGGLYYRRHNRSHSKDLEAAKKTLNLNTPKSPSVSPNRRSRRARKREFYLVLLMAVAICISLTGTIYLSSVWVKQDDSTATTTAGGRVVRFPAQEQDFASIALTNYEKSKASHLLNINNDNNGYPRVLVLEQHNAPVFKKRRLADDPMLHAPLGQEAAPQDDYDPNSYWDEDCEPMSEWQTASFPNCNTVHELDLRAAGPRVGKNHSSAVNFEDNLSFLGQGWFRHAMQVDIGAMNETVVLKMLRLQREFYGEFYDLHRRDAVAMERLTFSPFVMNIYGFCGQSAINEMASFGHGDITNLEKFDRRLRGKDTPQATFVKLQIATSVAVGVAHVHQVNGADSIPSMVHYDLNPRNIAITKGGKPKLNDFNICEFLRVNRKTNQTCAFPSRLHEPWWRAPEEVVLPKPGEVKLIDEKVDVFSLGNLLYHVLTTRSPRGKLDKRSRIETVRAVVAQGQPPGLHKFYIHSKDPAVIAFKKAMKMCFEANPQKRASAAQVADVLLDALIEIRAKNPHIHSSSHKAAAVTTTT